ncbi:hypothetical protein OK7_06162 [Enterococcus faecium EnGen0024]|uniref:Uncharacterized protein n=2 Tax=Enterococcus TaxID=1350 RepID=A0AAV3KYU3_ENTFC|nr:hypothetical protein [Enterococcus faecium]EFF26992.1 hypothetical protein EfmE1679_0880 [Enterococcus faecium E1679]ELB33510.1 hypothetical protein OK7_06162 [Enterococcus faecium EnGen0024]ERT47325.1 hypothetical protein O991_02900 [Enterococcus faecium 10/96A]OSP80183.1 hypothetical protein EFM1CSP_05255 [Enterococcus faecium]HAZ4688551.1 hypothetical protein [Enterococcus faecium]
MKDNVYLKAAMSVFYSLVLTLMLAELITKPVFQPLFDIAVHDTGIPANKLLIICLIAIFLFGFVLLFFQTGIYLMGLKLFNTSKENKSKIFPSLTLSMSIVGAIFLFISMFFDITNPLVLLSIPAVTLLLNSVIYYILSKDRRGFSIVLIISIVMYAMNGLINTI